MSLSRFALHTHTHISHQLIFICIQLSLNRQQTCCRACLGSVLTCIAVFNKIRSLSWDEHYYILLYLCVCVCVQFVMWCVVLFIIICCFLVCRALFRHFYLLRAHTHNIRHSRMTYTWNQKESWFVKRATNCTTPKETHYKKSTATTHRADAHLIESDVVKFLYFSVSKDIGIVISLYLSFIFIISIVICLHCSVKKNKIFVYILTLNQI